MLATAERWGGGAGERPYLPRAFSVLGVDGGELSFLLEDVGPGSRRLCELGEGDQLWLSGPFGVGFDPTGRDPLLVGGGVGIAPLAMLQDELGGAPALLGFRDAAHAEGAALLRDPQIATDDGSVGEHGFVTTLLERLLTSQQQVYACGPPAMLEEVRALCSARGVGAQLALEAPMACGFGACFGCVVATREGYRRVCFDGPVFEAALLAEVA
jgi:NAD(P)H-flavin reductase